MGTQTEPASLPVYRAGEVPEHLRTTTQLKAQRLKPADGQQPLAFLRMYRRGHGWGEFPLYDPGEAAPMRPLSAKQQAAKTARRTCPKCGEVCDYVVHRACAECREQERREQQEWLARRCWGCERVSLAPHPEERKGQCEPCWLRRVIRLQLEEERLVVWRRTCPGRDCDKATATDEEIAAHKAEHRSWTPVWCPPCKKRDERERAERKREREEAEQRAVEERRQRVAELVDWARELLADPNTVVLDTETTGLEDDARIVEAAVYSVDGDVLLNTLVNPGEPIPPDVSDLHGITDERVAGAPSFTALLPELTAVLEGRRCLIYNAPYDVGRLRHELTLHYLDQAAQDTAREVAATGILPEGLRERAVARSQEQAAAWVEAMRFEDVMIPYSEWVGEWDDYWGNYAWQPLIGGEHRALSDCKAVVDLLRGLVQSTAEA